MSELSQLFETDIYKILSAPAYTFAEASRLVGISQGQVSRWVRGYEYIYRVSGGKQERLGQQKAIVRKSTHKESTNVSFLDLIDLLFVRRFLKLGLSLQRIRKALDEARNYLETPHFASQRFFINGNKIFLDPTCAPNKNKTKNLIALLTGGQYGFREIVAQVEGMVDFEDVTGYGLSSRWFPNGRQGHVVVDPRISFGQPTVYGHRITTSNIYDMYIGENQRIDKIARWFDLSPTALKTAIQFEYNLYA